MRLRHIWRALAAAIGLLLVLQISLYRWIQNGGGVSKALRERVAAGQEAISFDWPSIMPELHPVYDQLMTCARGLLESVPIDDMSKLYTCGIQDVGKMRRQGQCVEEGLGHLQAVLNTSEPSDELLARYRSFEQEDRGHGAGLKIHCRHEEEELEGEFSLGPNVTITLVDRRPCHSSYNLLSSGRSNTYTLGPRSTHFATTHHLGSISYKKGGSPCALDLQSAVGKALGARGMQYKSTVDSFRGLYWYPPGGFTEWHTDGSQVQGWRVYLTHVSRENASSFVYRNPITRRAVFVPDRNFQANLFRVNGASPTPLWHAVVSPQAHRFSVGMAISDALADRLLRTLIH